MAENKKSFILYADLIHTVKKMPKEQAGELLLTILEYVNDENPTVDNMLVDLVFEPIKQQFKRDLVKWDATREKRSKAGRISAEKRAIKKQQVLTRVESVQQTPTNPTVNDNVNDNVNENVKNKKNNTIASSENYLKMWEEFPHKQEFLKVHKLFADKDKPKTDSQKTAWLNTYRLLIEKDGYSADKVLKLITWAKADKFWSSNMLSLASIRKSKNGITKIRQIEAKYDSRNNNVNKTNKQTNLDFISKGSDFEPTANKEVDYIKL